MLTTVCIFAVFLTQLVLLTTQLSTVFLGYYVLWCTRQRFCEHQLVQKDLVSTVPQWLSSRPVPE